ncbi:MULTISPECIES: hypothetical protein [unclassified Nocardiopsis]|uniref:hypothetical protein n=1 Tax=unclassified Nocardiopsis TaxID=2649073 RepID=UPI0013588A6B|nr:MULTISPECIES: hypothetical protein [unclassified Nocardiopsis]
MRFKVLLGVVLILLGAALSLFLWDARFHWFQGGPLGLLLIAVGVFEVAEEFLRGRRRPEGPEPGGDEADRGQNRD